MSSRISAGEQLIKLHQIGIALTGERDLARLLERIVDEARALTGADAGTLYLLEGVGVKASLRFEIVQTESLSLRMGGTTGVPVNWPGVPMHVGGKPNGENVCAHVALTGESVNIDDVYDAKGFDFEGTRRFDRGTGYRSRSMLVAPLFDRERGVIGVLQLVNALNEPAGCPVPFDPGHVELVASLASQAAVAIMNARLLAETEALFESFVQVMASAIDERSPATAGHIERVTNLTLALAQAVNQADHPPFSSVYFSEEELNELRIAAWMHDVGKVTTPVHLVEKETKLQEVMDRIDLISMRFELIKEQARRRFLERAGAHQTAGQDARRRELEAALQLELDELDAERRFVEECNRPTERMPDEHVVRLQALARKSYAIDGVEYPYLTADELERLCVQRGNITGEELAIMREHAAVTIRLLAQIPFTRKLARVPEYAGGHHEKLDGSGYPRGLVGDDLPIQTRIMAIADIFEALTADDRSYKAPCTPQEALAILKRMADQGEVDGDLVDLFRASGAYVHAGGEKFVDTRRLRGA